MDTAEKYILLCFLIQGVCCRDFNISLPEKIQALSGSCVIIKCRFEINEQYDNYLTDRAIGVWFKDQHNHSSSPVFSSSTSVQNSGIKGNITGQLKDENCTTVFTDIRSNHSGQYFFRIEGEGNLKWTFTNKNVSIDVIDSPKRPLVRVSVDGKSLPDDQEVFEVQEGSCVSVRCSAESLCSSPSPTLTWSSTPRIPLSERPQELISDLNFTADHTHHTLTVTCTVTYQLQECNATAHSNFTLHVQTKDSNSSVLIGVAGVSFVVLTLCVIITYTFIRKKNTSRLQTRQNDAVGSISSNEVVPQDPGDSVYVNKDMMSSAGASTANPETLIYSSIDFKTSIPRPQEVESVSSPHMDYAVVQNHSGRGIKTERPMGESLRPGEDQVTVRADVITKPKESSQIYSVVKHCR